MLPTCLPTSAIITLPWIRLKPRDALYVSWEKAKLFARTVRYYAVWLVFIPDAICSKSQLSSIHTIHFAPFLIH